ncbi:MAG: outer membrane beta-barrel family protein, partial [Bacteroidetes bacterium]|nr:outer membrane beta-barrel family protein [Bacteroidota bacterium]
ATFTLFKIIKLNPFFHFYSKSVSDGNIKNSGNSFTASLFTEIKLPWNTSVGVDLSLPGKEYYLQGFYQNNFRIDYLYGNMNILKGKGMLMAGIINPFTILTTETREVWDNTQLFTKNRMDNQMFFIKFSYSFNVGPTIKTLQRTYNMERDK